MNKKLSTVNLILLIIIVLSFVILFFFNKLNILSISLLAFMTLLILLILSVIDIKKEVQVKYNSVLLFSLVMTLVVILRSLFDKSISFNSFDSDMYMSSNTVGSMGITFLDYNMGFICIIFIGLLIHKVINKKEIE